jgi:hypothetical protein
MPNYDVGNRAAYLPWHIPAGPPRPRPVIHMGTTGVAVGLGSMHNIALHADATGLFTSTPSSSSVFAILWGPGGGLFARASLIHMPGAPDPKAVYWAAMLLAMGPGGSYYGILANSQSDVPSADFITAVLANTPIPESNVWVYNAEAPGGVFSFGVDWNGFAGEPLNQG